MSQSASLRARTLLVAALFGLVAVACGGGTDTTANTSDAIAAQNTDSGVDALAGEFVDLNGNAVELSNFEGQDVVLWFWAPW